MEKKIARGGIRNHDIRITKSYVFAYKNDALPLRHTSYET